MNLFNKFKNAVKGAVTQTVRLMTPEPIKEKVVKAVRKTIDYIEENINRVSEIVDNYEHMNRREEKYEQGKQGKPLEDIPSPYVEEYTREKRLPTESEKKWRPSEIRQAQDNDELWLPDENPTFGKKREIVYDYDPFEEIEEKPEKSDDPFSLESENSETYSSIGQDDEGNFVVEVNGDYKFAQELVTEKLNELPPNTLIIVKMLADFHRKDNGITKHWKSCTAVMDAESAANFWIAGKAQIESEYNVSAVKPIQYLIEIIEE